LWPAIRTQLQPQRRPQRWEQLTPATRLGWVLLNIALFLVMGAAAFALDPAVNKLFQQTVGWRHIEQAQLVQKLDLTQTMDDVTVTLQRVYADTNQIVVGYTVKTSDGQRHDPYNIKLMVHLARSFLAPSDGGTGNSDLLNVNLPPREGAGVLSFNAASIQGTPSILHLRLVMEAKPLVLPTPTPQLLPTPPDLADELDDRGRGTAHPKRDYPRPL
jgi:Domain of unknown function (DUF4179)